MGRLFLKFRAKVAEFRRNAGGTVAIIFGISVVPMMGLAGLAIDYSSVSKSRSVLQGIADAATLFSVSDQVIKPNVSWGDQKEASLAAAKKEFDALVDGLGARTILSSVSYEATIASNVITVKTCYVGAQSTTALNMVGVSSMTFEGCSEASSAPPLYVNVYVLADASGSMGVGATTAIQDSMIAKLGCAFACHTTSWLDPTCSSNAATTACAKKYGFQTRFDVIKTAFSKVIDQAEAMQKIPNQFRFGVFKFSNRITTVQSTTTSFSSTKSSIMAMDPDGAGAGSNMRYAFRQIKNELPTSGDGKSADNPKVFLLLMTDGVEGNVDEYSECRGSGASRKCGTYGSWNADTNFTTNGTGFWHGRERSQAIDPAMCNDLKSRGVVIATLNTEYAVSDTAASRDSRFNSIKSQLQPKIRDTMKQCATRPEFAFYATTPGEIEKASLAMFQSVMEKARIVK